MSDICATMEADISSENENEQTFVSKGAFPTGPHLLENKVAPQLVDHHKSS